MAVVSEFLSRPENVGTWTVVRDRSHFTFKNKTMWGLVNVKGRFTAFSGEGHIDGTGTVSGRIDVKAASVNTGIKKRDEHLRSDDFFAAERYPDITITVSGVDAGENDQVNVRAELSIRGNTVALPMRAAVAVLDDGCVRIAATTTVEREQLDVSGNIAGMVGKTATVSADVVLHRAGS